MSEMRPVAYGAIIGMLLACMLPALAAGGTSVGVIFDSPTPAQIETDAIHDAVLEGLGAVEGYEVVVLHPDSPLLAAWDVDPSALQINTADASSSLPELAAALDLDEVFHVDLSPHPGGGDGSYTVSVTRAKAAGSDIAHFQLPLSNTGSGALQELSRRLSETVGTQATETTPAPQTPSPQQPEQESAQEPGEAAKETKPPQQTGVAPALEEEKPQPEVAGDIPESTVDKPTPEPAASEAPETEGPETESEKPSQQPPPGQSHVQQARDALITGDRDLALRHLQAAVDAGEPQGAIDLLRADMARLESDHVARRKWLQKAAATQTHGTQASLRLAQFFADQGLWQKALETYRQVLEEDPDTIQAAIGMAGVLRDLDRPREAAKKLSEVVSRHPDNHALRVRLGDAYRDAGMLAEAEEAYDLAARSGDKELRARVFDKLGDLYVEADRYEEGFYCYAEAARLQSDSDAPLSAKRYRQIMSTADEAVLAAMKSTADAYDRYALFEDIPREAAYERAEKTVAQLEEVSKFAKSVSPPDAASRIHLQRKLFYNVALEAAVSLMTYLDTNLDVALNQYESTVEHVDEEYRALKSAGG